MSFIFVKPDKTRDAVTAGREALFMLLQTLRLTEPTTGATDVFRVIPRASGHFSKMIEAIKITEDDRPENLAWKWLSMTLLEATAQFLVHLRKDTIINAKDKEEAVESFLKSALNVPANCEFNSDIISDLPNHCVVQPTVEALPELIAALTSMTKWNSDNYKTAFKKHIQIASSYVIASNYKILHPIIDAVSSPLGDFGRKENSWIKHYNWLHNRFNQEPVFSPDGSVKTPLSELYLRLRCYWHRKKVEDTGGENAREVSYYQAYLGDIHTEIENWVNTDTEDRIRVVAGGPGSGKSSFAKAIASELAYQGNLRVVYIELQRVLLSGRLEDDIGDYVTGRDGNTALGGSAGFPENPLAWLKKEGSPSVLIFDGLDELTHDDQAAKQKAREFILQAKSLVSDARADGANIKVLILGRNLSCQDGIKAAGLGIECLINVAPIRELFDQDFSFEVNTSRRETRVDARPPTNLADFSSDLRPEYWKKWVKSQGITSKIVPEAITNDALSDLNVEPLLLHLLILSDFCGDRWKEAAKNRNLVYEDLLKKICDRNKIKRNSSPKLEYPEFILLMECLGLTAWRGNGRAGNEVVYEKIKAVHARHRQAVLKELGDVNMSSMVLQTHARRVEGDIPGFEFIHKTFGEYLAARGLISFAIRISNLLTNEAYPADEEAIAKDWISVVFDGELTGEIIRFLRDEARRVKVKNDFQKVNVQIQKLFAWTTKNGFPNLDAEGGTFREWETRQRCSDAALLAVACAVVGAFNEDVNGGSEPLSFDIDWGDVTPMRRLHAIGVSVRNPVCSSLEGINLEGVVFYNAYLAHSNFRFAKFSAANLSEADMRECNLVRANFEDAVLIGTYLEMSNLHQAKLDGADLDRVFANGAYFAGATFERASIEGGNLRSADISKCVFKNTKMGKTDLTCCRALATDFSKAIDLVQKQVDSIFGVKSGKFETLLPKDLTPPVDWFESDQKDESEFEAEFLAAYRKWIGEIRKETTANK